MTRRRRKPAVPKLDAVRAKLRDEFELDVVEQENYEPAKAAPLLRNFLNGLENNLDRPALDPVLSSLKDCGVEVVEGAPEEPEEDADIEAAIEPEPALTDDPVPVPAEDVPTDENLDGGEAFPQAAQHQLDAPSFSLAPLASAIQMFEAMLNEAKAGYIAGRIGELQDVLGETFDMAERELLADAASRWRDAAGLPDVGNAYQALVEARGSGAL